MEYQKIANLIDDNTLNQPYKFRTRNWIEINDESRGTYNVNSQIKFKTTMLKSSLCDYSDAYILVKGTISANNTAAQGAAANNANKTVIFKNCAPFTNCINEINNTQIDNAKDIDIVMPMYNLIEYSVNYAKTTGSLWKYCKDIPARNANDEIVIFADGNANNFPHELLLTNRKAANTRKAFAKNTPIDIKLSKTQLTKMIQSGGFLGNLLGKLAGPLMKVAMPLAKNVLAPLGISAAISAIDGSIKKKMLGSGTTTLIISNDEMNDILKIVKSLENSGLLLKGVSETIQHEAKEQRG